MDENRLSGTAKNPHGQKQRAEDSVQDLYGQAKGARQSMIACQRLAAKRENAFTTLLIRAVNRNFLNGNPTSAFRRIFKRS